MRYKYLCVAAVLSSALLGDATLHPSDAVGSRLGNSSGSPILVINMRTYRWNLPEFRMAGRDAYALVQVENTHDYALQIFVDCRTDDGRIPEMSGYYTVRPREFLRMDTRRQREPMQAGDGVKVTCRFRSDGSAKVEAWVYDEQDQGNG